MATTKLGEGLYWVGVQDPDLRVFDIIMETPYGTSYNSYLVQGQEHTVLIDTVKAKRFDEFLQNLQEVVKVEDIDYLVLNHTEPDHSGAVEQLLQLNPQIKVLGSANAIVFVKEIVNKQFTAKVVADREILDLGGRTLQFIAAPFLHWPDSIFTYLKEDGVLFTGDAFGSHYSDDRLSVDQLGADATKQMEAFVYYYDKLLLPFKNYLREALAKIDPLTLNLICPSHGSLLEQTNQQYIELYRQWTEPADAADVLPKVVVPYVSVYGYTQELGEMIIEGIESAGEIEVTPYDLVESDPEAVLQAVTEADGLVVGSCTINGDTLPPVWDLLTRLSPIVHSRLLGAAFGAYGWSGEAVPNIEQRLRSLRMEVLPGFKVNFKPTEGDLEKAFNFGLEYGKALLEKGLPQSERKWRCVICGHIHQGEAPPAVCPACGVGAENFVPSQSEEEFTKDTKEKFVIVGGGIAAQAAAKALRERNRTATIDLLTEEDTLPYYRPILTDLLAADAKEDDLFVVAEAWYQEQQITVHTKTQVGAIDSGGKTVTTAAGEVIPYDKLILATGARSRTLALPGADKAGVYTLRSLADARKIRQAMAGAKKVVILGGGLIGLEVAWQMVEAGLTVSLVEAAATLMPRQLDPPTGQRLQALIEAKGAWLYLGRQAAEILGEQQAQGVRLDDGQVVEGDLVLVSAGVLPNAEAGIAAGLVQEQGSINVDKQMRTNVSTIYAAGDVARFKEQPAGLWALALEMGRIAGAAAAGDWLEYQPPLVPTMLQAFGKEVFSIGEVNFPEGSCRIVEVTDPVTDYYKKSFFQDGVLRGEIIIAEKAEGLDSLGKLGRDAGGQVRHNKWKCRVCGYEHEGPEPPDFCPICGASRDSFRPID